MDNWEKNTKPTTRSAAHVHRAFWTVAIVASLVWLAAQIAPGVGGWLNLTQGVIGLLVVWAIANRFLT